MLVSAVSAKSFQLVFNTRNNGFNANRYSDTSFVFNPSNVNKIFLTDQASVFDHINEWKNFCHKQIEQGKYDIIA